MNRVNLVGRRFGMLTVIDTADDYITPRGQRKPRWKCLCDCGNTAVVIGTNLKSGHTLSCGCLGLERRIQSRKRQNEYCFSGNQVTGFTANGEPFIFDADMYEAVIPFSWYKSSNGYIATRIQNNELILLHQIIMGTDGFRKKFLVDHINHDKTDNRKCNLRLTTKVRNAQNCKMRTDNVSGVTGVSWSRKYEVWRAYIPVDKHQISLGQDKNSSDAVAARKAAEEKYFGSYSYDNSMAAVPRIEAHTDQPVRAAG